MWPPEISPRTHDGYAISFTDAADDEPSVVRLGKAAARRHIDRLTR